MLILATHPLSTVDMIMLTGFIICAVFCFFTLITALILQIREDVKARKPQEVELVIGENPSTPQETVAQHIAEQQARWRRLA